MAKFLDKLHRFEIHGCDLTTTSSSPRPRPPAPARRSRLAGKSSSGRKTRTLRHCLPTATTDPSDGLDGGSGSWPCLDARTRAGGRGGVETLLVLFRAALPASSFPSFLAAIIFPIVVNLSASWCFHLISHCNGLFLGRSKERTEPCQPASLANGLEEHF